MRNVGIQAGEGNMLEYLLWVLMRDAGKPFRIEHVEVCNATRSIGLNGFNSYFPVNI